MAKFFEESEIKSIPVQVFMLSFIREIMKDTDDDGFVYFRNAKAPFG